MLISWNDLRTRTRTGGLKKAYDCKERHPKVLAIKHTTRAVGSDGQEVSRQILSMETLNRRIRALKLRNYCPFFFTATYRVHSGVMNECIQCTNCI